jgi:hypothetical protein
MCFLNELQFFLYVLSTRQELWELNKVVKFCSDKCYTFYTFQKYLDLKFQADCLRESI